MHISHNLKTRHSVFVHIVLKTVQLELPFLETIGRRKSTKSLELASFADMACSCDWTCHVRYKWGAIRHQKIGTRTQICAHLYMIRTVFLLIVHRHSFFLLVQPHAQVWQTAATANRIFWRFDVSCKVRMHFSRHLKFGRQGQLFAYFYQEQSNNVPFTGDRFFWFAKAQFSIFPERVHSKYANYLNI